MPDTTNLNYGPGFGVPGSPDNVTGRSEQNSVQVAEAVDHMGTKRLQRTYGQETTITEDAILVSDFENEAIEGQDGDEVTSGHNLDRTNEGFATTQRTLRRIPGGGFEGAATTTPSE